jgi:choline dehydrogenase-like flavoprotein
MQQFHNTMSITVTLKDNPTKSRIVLKDGRAKLDFRESKQDIENLRKCFLLSAKAYLALGARRVFLPILRPPVIERETDLRKIENLKFGYEDLILYSDHTSSGNQIGADQTRGVTDAGGRFWGTVNVYAADSSLFPTAPGVNPSWTIMALSHRIATKLASISSSL